MTDPKRTMKIPPERMHLAQYARRDWCVNAEEGTTVEDVLKPEFWTHKASELTPYDRIEVRPDNGQWIAELLVLQVSRNWARTHLLVLHDLGPKEDEDSSAAMGGARHDIKWKGPQRKWAVVRLADLQVVMDGFDDKLKARAWMENHETVVDRT